MKIFNVRDIFIEACYFKKLNIVRHIINKGFDILTNNGQLFIEACGNGDIKTARYLFDDYLLNKGMCKDINKGFLQSLLNRSLYETLNRGYVQVTRYLIKKGADIHFDNDSCILNIIKSKITVFMIKNYKFKKSVLNKVFVSACLEGSTVIARELLATKKINIDYDNGTPLRNAVYYKQTSIIKLLVYNNVNVHINNNEIIKIIIRDKYLVAFNIIFYHVINTFNKSYIRNNVTNSLFRAMYHNKPCKAKIRDITLIKVILKFDRYDLL